MLWHQVAAGRRRGDAGSGNHTSIVSKSERQGHFLAAATLPSRIPLSGAGVPLERVSILLGHSSIRITEKHYSPWVRSRQEQLEADVRATWDVTESATKGTREVHGEGSRAN
jgi:hypothetical protein